VECGPQAGAVDRRPIERGVVGEQRLPLGKPLTIEAKPRVHRSDLVADGTEVAAGHHEADARLVREVAARAEDAIERAIAERVAAGCDGAAGLTIVHGQGANRPAAGAAGDAGA